MKTFRLIGMALLAIMLCVNFTGCSKENPTDDETLTKPKKLIGMKEIDYSGTHIWEFSYDSKDRLSSIIYTNDWSNHQTQQVTRFTWNSFTITAESDYETRTYTLDNNLVKTIRCDQHPFWSNTEFSYNSSNQLLITEKTTKTYTEYYKYIWENEKISKITSINDYYTDITYSGKTCKGYFPFYNSYDDIFYAHPELIGLRNSQLPKQIFYKEKRDLTEEYSYTFDKDGYIEKCTIVSTDISNMQTSTTVYTLKWE